jgi:hypothetical protein
LLFGQHTLAGQYLVGFHLFTAVSLVVFLALLSIIGTDLWRKNVSSDRVLGCAVFAFCILTWERNTLVRHYGVPVIGHFFERPQYDARYYVEARRAETVRKLRLKADIHVALRSEVTEEAEDRFGQVFFSFNTERDVWVRRLHFPNGGSVAIEDQFEPLQLDGSTMVTDTRGEKWHLKLLDEPVR